ncbi:Zinc finger, RING-type [Dillenia turbinata]|uniref:Zinc finger, RING-type n=1 Tax=Dillenia turbinata TaxID=194707 RepID=A0AAN8VP74_9MAGN
MLEYQLTTSSYQNSLQVLEADIQQANLLASSIPRTEDGACLQMKLAYNHLAPVFLFLLQWLDCSCACLLPSYLNLFHVLVYQVYPDGRSKITSHGRKATIGEFYAVILPSLQRMHSNILRLDGDQDECKTLELISRKKQDETKRLSDLDLEREDECGICLEPCTKIVLPSCCHAMCSSCYHDWNTRSESCPFCRGSLKRVKSGDLWVLTCGKDVVDMETVSKEEMLRFYLYINGLPRAIPDAFSLAYHEYIV